MRTFPTVAHPADVVQIVMNPGNPIEVPPIPPVIVRFLDTPQIVMAGPVQTQSAVRTSVNVPFTFAQSVQPLFVVPESVIV